jgi:hypothetical protein
MDVTDRSLSNRGCPRSLRPIAALRCPIAALESWMSPIASRSLFRRESWMSPILLPILLRIVDVPDRLPDRALKSWVSPILSCCESWMSPIAYPIVPSNRGCPRSCSRSCCESWMSPIALSDRLPQIVDVPDLANRSDRSSWMSPIAPLPDRSPIALLRIVDVPDRSPESWMSPIAPRSLPPDRSPIATPIAICRLIRLIRSRWRTIQIRGLRFASR